MYAKRIRIEARAMLHMAGKDYIPAVIRYLNSLDPGHPVQRGIYEKISILLADVEHFRGELEEKTAMADRLRETKTVAEAFRREVVPVMDALRRAVDQLEMLVDRGYWPVPTYGDLMFEV